MAAPIIRGDNSPQTQKETYKYDYRQGGVYTKELKGSSIPKMIQYWNGVIYTASRGTMSFVNGVATAEIEWSGFPGGSGGTGSTSAKELTIDRWEIPEPKTEKPRVNHPKMYDIFYALSQVVDGYNINDLDGYIGSLAAKFQEGVSGNQPAKDFVSGEKKLTGWFNETNFPGIVGGISNDALHYLYRQYQRCLNGQTHYQDQTYAVRHTTNAPSYWSANIADNNANCIYTTAQLLSELQNSDFWYFPLPARLAYKINAASNNFINQLPKSAFNRTGYMVGWLKSPFGEASVGRTRMEIQGGYVLDQWPLDDYPAAT